MAHFMEMYEAGNACMRAGDFATANDHYRETWHLYGQARREAAKAGDVRVFDAAHTPAWAFWLLMSGVNARFSMGDYSGCYETGASVFQLFKGIGLVAGNPVFHLRMGQSSFELDTPEQRADIAGPTVDNLARALICGGIEIYKGEDPKYLDTVLAVLDPPNGFDSWHDTVNEGCSMDLLNESHGYLREWVTRKYGAPPPYPAPTDS